MSNNRAYPVRNCDLCQFDAEVMLLADLWRSDGNPVDGEERYYWTQHAIAMCLSLYTQIIDRSIGNPNKDEQAE